MRSPTAVALLLAVLAGPARAADCSRDRLDFLSGAIGREATTASRWTLAWGSVYGGLTLAQLAVAPLIAEPDRPDWYWGALSTGVGVAFTVIDPLEVIAAGPTFLRRAAAASSDAEVCELVVQGERLLRDGAEHERTGTRWYWHAANVAFNAVMGLVLGVAYGHWVSGLVNFLVGAAIGEATIFTQPTNLIGAWEEYSSPAIGGGGPGLAF